MLTGLHLVRDVFCICCHQKLGWAYDCAAEESQRYKEGKVILENAYIENYRGFDDEDNEDSTDNTDITEDTETSTSRSTFLRERPFFV